MTFSKNFKEFGKAMELSQNQNFTFEVQRRSLDSMKLAEMSETDLVRLKEVCLGLFKQNMILQNVNNFHLRRGVPKEIQNISLKRDVL